MSEDDILSTGQAYQYDLLEDWKEIKKFSKVFRENYMNNSADTRELNAYIVLLTRFWLELAPKVKDRQEFGAEFLEAFNSFKPFYENPKLLVEPRNAKKIAELEAVLRMALEKLKITSSG